MLNEEIVSTFIYVSSFSASRLPSLPDEMHYFAEENITESRLAFRTSIVEPLYDGQDDDDCTSIIYGVRRSVFISHLVLCTYLYLFAQRFAPHARPW